MKTFTVILLVLASSLAAQNNSKNLQPDEVISTAKRLTDLSAAGPLRLTAKVKLLGMTAGPLDAEFTLHWAGPENWRQDWRFQQWFQSTAIANGKEWSHTNISKPAFRFLQFESALQTIWTWNSVPRAQVMPSSDPVEYEARTQRAEIPTMGAVRSTCLSAKGSKWVSECFTVDSGLPLLHNKIYGEYVFDDYAEYGGMHYPRRIKVVGFRDRVEIEAELSVEQWNPVDSSLFQAPVGVAASDLPDCLSSGANEKIKLPSLVSQKRPEYPNSARALSREGVVVLDAVIAKDGSISRLEVLQSGGTDLDKASLDAVKEWKYSPYLICGEPQEARTVLTVNYSLAR